MVRSWLNEQHNGRRGRSVNVEDALRAVQRFAVSVFENRRGFFVEGLQQ